MIERVGVMESLSGHAFFGVIYAPVQRRAAGFAKCTRGGGAGEALVTIMYPLALSRRALGAWPWQRAVSARP